MLSATSFAPQTTPDHPDAVDTTAISFADLGLPGELVTVLNRQGLTTPFPIQVAAIPDALAGRDVLGRGSTGSGKTLAFGLPMLGRLAGRPARSGRPLGLVLVPTRELAFQVADALTPLGRSVGVTVTPIVGGAAMSRQIDAVRRGVHLVVATPGRLEDHVRRGTCDLGDVEITALDEADQMADMGFLPAVRALLDRVRPDGQRLLFSATLDGDVDTLIRHYLVDPVTHSLAPVAATVDTMGHHFLRIAHADRTRAAAAITQVTTDEGWTPRAILFVKTQAGADRLVEQLAKLGVAANALHGGKTQGQRNRVLGDFRAGRLGVLVATDVAARGVHVDGIDAVVHVDPPADPKAYLHRAGRTARAGASGVVVTLVASYQNRGAKRLAQVAGVEPVWASVDTGDALPAALVEAVREVTTEPVVVEPTPERERPARSQRPRNGGPRDRDRDRRSTPARGRSHPRTDRPHPEHSQAPGHSDGPRRPNRSDRPERPKRSGWAERPERPERPERFERGERFERPQRSGWGERPERPERPRRSGWVDRPQRSEGAERPERPKRSDWSERPQRTERPAGRVGERERERTTVAGPFHVKHDRPSPGTTPASERSSAGNGRAKPRWTAQQRAARRKATVGKRRPRPATRH